MGDVGFARVGSPVPLNRDQALVELARAIHEILLEVATTFRSTITYQGLATEAQRRTHIRAGQPAKWLPAAITMVVRVTHRLAEPPLTALVVSSTDRTVGPLFDEVRRTEGVPVLSDPDEREQAAAVARLECYRRYAPHVPDDAAPILVTPAAAQRSAQVRTPRATAARPATKAAKAAKPAKAAAPRRRDPDENLAPHVLCSSCFLQTPPGDECQNCGAPLR